MVVARVLVPALRRLRVKLLEMLGRNSLQVFAALSPVCALVDGLIGLPRQRSDGARPRRCSGSHAGRHAVRCVALGLPQRSSGSGCGSPRAIASAISYRASQRAGGLVGPTVWIAGGLVALERQIGAKKTACLVYCVTGK